MFRSQRVGPEHREGERGVALVLGIFFSIIVVGITVSGALILRSHQTKTRTNFVTHGQAVQFARSGLIEAWSWLRRQTTQPVTVFEPRLDPTAVPAVFDTIDPEIGLVREFPIAGAIWGRYEVWKDWAADPDPDRLAWREHMRVEDVSTPRNQRGAGGAWKLRSIGYVFRRTDPARGFDELPNQVLGQEILEVEARRLIINLPGQAALCVRDGNSAHINTFGRIYGGSEGGGILYPSNSGTPTVGPTNERRVTGSPPLSTSSNYDDSPEAIFGVSYDELRAMADLVITDEDDFPSPVPNYNIIVAEGDSFHFDASRPLSGTGLVYITGNVSINPGSNSNFSGLLYVDGNLTVRQPSEIRGSVICTGNVTVQGAQDYAIIAYDDEVLSNLRLRFGNYRLATTLGRPVTGAR